MDSIISIKGLRKSYGSKEVLKGIDLEVKRGEVIGYIGPNGAGKSTTVKIILGLISDFEGEVNILGYNIRDEDISYKSRVGLPEPSIVQEESAGSDAFYTSVSVMAWIMTWLIRRPIGLWSFLESAMYMIQGLAPFPRG